MEENYRDLVNIWFMCLGWLGGVGSSTFVRMPSCIIVRSPKARPRSPQLQYRRVIGFSRMGTDASGTDTKLYRTRTIGVDFLPVQL